MLCHLICDGVYIHLLAAFKNAAVKMPAAKVDGTNRYYRQNRYFNNYKMHCNNYLKPNISDLT